MAFLAKSLPQAQTKLLSCRLGLKLDFRRQSQVITKDTASLWGWVAESAILKTLIYLDPMLDENFKLRWQLVPSVLASLFLRYQRIRFDIPLCVSVVRLTTLSLMRQLTAETE